MRNLGGNAKCYDSKPRAFNEKLRVYLEFYNAKRVHYAFKNKMTPLEVLSKSEYYIS